MRLLVFFTLFTFSFSALSGNVDIMFKNDRIFPSAPLSMASLTPNQVSANYPLRQGTSHISMRKDISLLVNLADGKKIYDGRQVFPDISFDWVQNEAGEVIPSVRHLVVSDSKYWDYILGVGKVWPDTMDDDSKRVSMPFTLVEKGENCTHNGVIVFESGNSEGQFYFQISSETCAYFKADFWGRGDASNTFLAHKNSEDILAKYEQEKKSRLKTQPIEMLAEKTSKIKAQQLALPEGIASSDMTAYGVLLDDTHYVSECQTRAGNYPFCEQMVLPSYSTAKSIFGGLTMFYLEQKYGDVFSQPVNKWIKQCKSDRWDKVTFADLLDMSTGNYTSKKYSADEASSKKLAFFDAKTNNERLSFACKHYSRKSKPGTTFVYHTSDTYLLGAALSAYVKDKLGPDTDLFTDVLNKSIFAPLGLSEVSAESRRTSDKDGQPYVGYGLFFTRDDLVRLSRFVSSQAHVESDSTVFAKAPLQAALQLSDTNRGLTTEYNHILYQHGFWAREVSNKSLCQNQQWIPFMSGYGGITVALLAKTSVYYYVSDSFHFDWSDAIPPLHELDIICPTSLAEK